MEGSTAHDSAVGPVIKYRKSKLHPGKENTLWWKRGGGEGQEIEEEERRKDATAISAVLHKQTVIYLINQCQA